MDLRLIRDKEEKQDYRYMPEPNLPPLRLANLNLEPSKFISRIPTLPEDERSHLIKQYQLDLKTVLQLMVSDKLKNILIELNIEEFFILLKRVEEVTNILNK